MKNNGDRMKDEFGELMMTVSEDYIRDQMAKSKREQALKGWMRRRINKNFGE